MQYNNEALPENNEALPETPLNTLGTKPVPLIVVEENNPEIIPWLALA
jgi:hypothetical protein